MAIFITVLWAVVLFVAWTGQCQSKLAVVKMRNATSQLSEVQTRVSQLSSEYEKVEGVCSIWAHKKKKEDAKPRNCLDVQSFQPQSGEATIYLDDDTPLRVYCDQKFHQGGWTVFQRRQDGSVNFYRNWTQYQAGFGNLSGEFWLGLEALHRLTTAETYDLRVDMIRYDGVRFSATYSKFSISGSDDNYRLYLGQFTGGIAVDGLSENRNQQFSTVDADNDSWKEGHCGELHHGAWWYSSCGPSNLNGLYQHRRVQRQDAVFWKPVDSTNALKFSQMKIRPRQKI